MGNRMKWNGNNRRFKRISVFFPYIGILLFSVIYITAVNNILTEDYMVGINGVVSYGKEFDFLKSIFSILLVESTFFITNRFKSESVLINYVKYFLFVLYIVPVFLSYGLFEWEYLLEFIFLNLFYWLFFCVCCRVLCLKLKPVIKKATSRKKEYVILPVLIVFLTFYMVKSIGGVDLSVTLDDVYSTRQAFKDSATIFLVILKTCFGMYVCPCMLVRSLKEKKIVYIVLYAFLQIVMYSLAKDKMYLFILLVAILFGIWGNRVVENIEKWFSVSLIALGGMNVLALCGIMQNFIFNIFIRRFFTVPAWLNWVYFYVFYDKEKIWWRQDTFFIDKYLVPVYEESIVQIVAGEYFANKVANPNAGMFAEAYTRCGVFGIIIYPILLVFLLNILNLVMKKLDKSTLLMFAFSLSIVLCNDTITSTSFVCTMLIVNLFFGLLVEN